MKKFKLNNDKKDFDKRETIKRKQRRKAKEGYYIKQD